LLFKQEFSHSRASLLAPAAIIPWLPIPLLQSHTADNPALQAHFGQPGNQSPGGGFPMAYILARLHAGTGLFLPLLLAVTDRVARCHSIFGMLTGRIGNIWIECRPGYP
jgi:hypothetical protein